MRHWPWWTLLPLSNGWDGRGRCSGRRQQHCIEAGKHMLPAFGRLGAHLPALGGQAVGFDAQHMGARVQAAGLLQRQSPGVHQAAPAGPGHPVWVNG